MIKDEKKYLEEVMNCRTLKLLHRHVIIDGNVLLIHNLLKPPQVRPSFLRRVMGLPLGGLDEVASGGLDESKSRICTMDGCLAGAGGTTEPVLKTLDLDDPCLAFLWPRQLGRLPTSIVLERAFFSPRQLDEVGSGLLPSG